MSCIDQENYYLDIAEAVLKASACKHIRSGAVLVQSGEVIATGFNAVPTGRTPCDELPQEDAASCHRCVHAEVNAILSAGKKACHGASLYLVQLDAATGAPIPNPLPCSECRKLIINAGISQVIVRNSDRRYTVCPVRDWIFEDDTLPGAK